MVPTLRVSFMCVALAACSGVPVDGDTEGDVGQEASALVQDNGMRLNGMRLNGMRLNGMRLNGMRLNGMRLNGMRLNGTALAGTVVSVDGSGQEYMFPVEGEDLVGAELIGELENGAPATLRIETVRRSDVDPDLYYYGVTVWDPEQEGWEPACGWDWNGNIEALPVPGVWDYSEGTATGGAHYDTPDKFTFGCADAAIGKCVEWGYKPWDSVQRCETDRRGNQTCWLVPRADYHQSCTRLVRADYCGNGLSSTEDGTVINVYDDVGIEDRDTSMSWAVEAEWGPDGATCIRRKSDLRHDPAPRCTRTLRSSSCGSDWDNPETLIMTDLPAL
jgi:hypothetical protein